jgi:hypothetical protein
MRSWPGCGCRSSSLPASRSVVPCCEELETFLYTPSRAAQRWPGLPARRPPAAARPAHRGIDPSSMVDMLAAKRASFRYAGTPNDSKEPEKQKRRAPSLVVMPTASSKSAGQGVGHSALDPQGTPAGRHWQSGQPRTRASCGLDVVPRRGLVWPATDPPEQILKTGVGTSRQSPPRGMLAAQTPSSRRLKRAPYRSGTTSPLPAASLGSVAPPVPTGPSAAVCVGMVAASVHAASLLLASIFHEG